MNEDKVASSHWIASDITSHLITRSATSQWKREILHLLLFKSVFPDFRFWHFPKIMYALLKIFRADHEKHRMLKLWNIVTLREFNDKTFNRHSFFLENNWLVNLLTKGWPRINVFQIVDLMLALATSGLVMMVINNGGKMKEAKDKKPSIARNNMWENTGQTGLTSQLCYCYGRRKLPDRKNAKPDLQLWLFSVELSVFVVARQSWQSY